MTKQRTYFLSKWCFNLKILTLFLCLGINSCATNEPLNSEKKDTPRPETRKQILPEGTNSAPQPDQNTMNPNAKESEKNLFPPPLPQQKDKRESVSEGIDSVQTDDEKVMNLEEKLDGSLREFDEMLLKKNQDLTLKSSQGGGDSQNGSSGNGRMGRDTVTNDENGTKESPVSPITGSGHKSGGTIEQSKEFDNDDVVARQIREAAESETDPELKEKLWAEYRKYKAGSN